MKIKTKKINL